MPLGRWRPGGVRKLIWEGWGETLDFLQWQGGIFIWEEGFQGGLGLVIIGILAFPGVWWPARLGVYRVWIVGYTIVLEYLCGL